MKKLLLVTAFCFSFALFFSSGFSNSVFGQEKDSNSSSITIPTTLSEDAQNALENITNQMPEFVIPKPDDLKGWEELNRNISSMSIVSIPITCK